MFYQRKKIRLQNYDYSLNNFYFVTICCQNREKYFGKIENGQAVLNSFGRIVEKQWLWLEENYSYVFLDEYIVMPDHFHGILRINKSSVESRPDNTENEQKIKSLSQLIGAFKTTSSKAIHLLGQQPEPERSQREVRSRPDPTGYFKWQKSFYDRIIRSELELNNVRQYIINNPVNWEKDINNSKFEINEKQLDDYYEKIFR